MKKILLYSNEPDVVYGSYDGLKKAYEEYCEENDDEIKEGGEFDWFYEGLDSDYFLEHISMLDKQAYKFLLVGSAGTWQGRKNGGKISDDLGRLIDKATNKMDYVSIYLEDGAIEIRASHHDGTNYWTIHALNLRAETTINKWEDELSDEELHNKLDKNYYWKKLKL